MGQAVRHWHCWLARLVPRQLLLREQHFRRYQEQAFRREQVHNLRPSQRFRS